MQDMTNRTEHDLTIAPIDITFELNSNIIDQEDGAQKLNIDF
jgi:hypothetical protein